VERATIKVTTTIQTQILELAIQVRLAQAIAKIVQKHALLREELLKSYVPAGLAGIG